MFKKYNSGVHSIMCDEGARIVTDLAQDGSAAVRGFPLQTH
jgi:hypothetical protein